MTALTSMDLAHAGASIRRVERMVAARAVSSVGTRLTTFAMDVWVFSTTQSYWAFVLMAFLATATTLSVAFKAGELVDSSHKGRILFGAELLSMAAILGALVAILTGNLNIPIACVTTVLLTGADVFRRSSLQATIAALVPRSEIARISGTMEAYRSATIMVGPLLGAVAYATIGLKGIFLCDLATFAVCLVSLRGMIRETRLSPSNVSADRNGVAANVALSWLKERTSFIRLLSFIAFINSGFAVVSAVQSPFILSTQSPSMLSVAITSLGLGTWLGGKFFPRIARHTNAETGVLGGVVVESLAMVFLGASAQPWSLLCSMFVMGVSAAVVASANQTIWQLNVPYELQGRIMSIRMVVAQSTPLMVLMLTVPLQRAVFEPLVAAGSGDASSTIAQIWGTHDGSSIGMMVSCLATFILLTTLIVLGRGGLGLRRLSDSR